MSEQHPLDPYVELVGKVPPEKIAETAGVELAEVEAWLADREPSVKGKAKSKPASKSAPAPAPRRAVEAIQVLQATAISVENKRGQRLRIPVPRSIYRGNIARKYAQLLREDEFRVIEYAR